MVSSVKSERFHRLLSRKFVFPFLAFILPFLFRAIPEILMGPYLVGFDTLGPLCSYNFVVVDGEICLF